MWIEEGFLEGEDFWIRIERHRLHRTYRCMVKLPNSKDPVSLCSLCNGACCKSFLFIPLLREEKKRKVIGGKESLYFRGVDGFYGFLTIDGCPRFEEVSQTCHIFDRRPESCRKYLCVYESDYQKSLIAGKVPPIVELIIKIWNDKVAENLTKEFSLLVSTENESSLEGGK